MFFVFHRPSMNCRLSYDSDTRVNHHQKLENSEKLKRHSKETCRRSSENWSKWWLHDSIHRRRSTNYRGTDSWTLSSKFQYDIFHSKKMNFCGVVIHLLIWITFFICKVVDAGCHYAHLYERTMFWRFIRKDLNIPTTCMLPISCVTWLTKFWWLSLSMTYGS